MKTLTEIVKSAFRSATLAGAITLGTLASPAYAQEKPSRAPAAQKDKDKKEQEGRLGFRFSDPDAAFPGNDSYGQITGMVPLSDYSGAGGNAHARVGFGDYAVSGNVSFFNGDTHPNANPFMPEVTLPDVDLLSEDVESDMDSHFASFGFRSPSVRAFVNHGAYDKEITGNQVEDFGLGFPFQFRGITDYENTLESDLIAGGIGYQFLDAFQADVAFFKRDREENLLVRDRFRIENVSTVPPTLVSETLDVSRDMLEQSRTGAIISGGYRVNKDLTVDGHATIYWKKLEDLIDSDTETVFRPFVRGTYSVFSGGIGFITDNDDGDSQFIAAGDIVIPFSETTSMPITAGIDDNGNGYGAAFLTIGGSHEASQDFAQYLTDFRYDPTMDETRRYYALREHFHRLVRQHGFVLGAYLKQEREPEVNEQEVPPVSTFTVDREEEKTRILPMLGFSLGEPGLVSIIGDFGKDHQSGGAQLYIPITKNIAAGSEFEFTKGDKDSLFDDEYRVGASLIIKW